MNARLLNPSNYFSPADFQGELTARILDVRLEDVEDNNNRTKRKGSIALEGQDKPWLANVTNTKCLVAMFGDETDAWKGKRVTLFAERVMAFGEWTLGVRLRGSPDIAQPVSVRIKLRKKKEQVLTMQPTGPKPNGSSTAKPTPPPKQPGPYDEMWRDYKAAGLSDPGEFKALVKEALGKMSGFTPDDVFQFASVLASRAPGNAPQPTDAPPF